MKKRTDRANIINLNFFSGNLITIDSSTFKWLHFCSSVMYYSRHWLYQILILMCTLILSVY